MRTNFQFSCDPPVARLRIIGELDFTAKEQLRDVLATLAYQGCRHLEVDLGAITFIDLRSMRLLDEEQARLRGSGGSLSVVAASAGALLVIDAAGFPALRPDISHRPSLTAPPRRRSHYV